MNTEFGRSRCTKTVVNMCTETVKICAEKVVNLCTELIKLCTILVIIEMCTEASTKIQLVQRNSKIVFRNSDKKLYRKNK